MKQLNPLYYALIDSDDNYYSTNETRPYLDLKIIYNRYTYDFSTGKPVETKTTTKSKMKDCEEDDFNSTSELRSFYTSTV